MNHIRSTCSAWVAVALLAACGGTPTDGSGDDGGDGGGGGGGGGSGTRVIKGAPAFTADIQEIFTRRGCTASGCHGSGSSSAGLSLAVGQSYLNLVNVAGSADPSILRVKPNDANNSLLVLRVEGDDAGAQMPLSGAPLDNIDRTNIRNWINTGAPNN